MELQLKKVILLTIMTQLLTVNAKSSPNEVVVAQDGTGDFSTITSAISAAPNNSRVSYYIKIKAGIYAETIRIDETKRNLVLVGEGINQTIITGNRSRKGGIETYDSAIVGIRANNFLAEGISFINVAGPEMEQAVAVRIEAYNVVFFRCQFTGYQDTLYTLFGTHFFRDCDILGTVDFIFGDAAVIFQNCRVLARKPLAGQSNTITAQGREDKTKETGIVFQNCTIMSAPDLKQHELEAKSYFGRPWRNFSRTIIMQSNIDTLIDQKGWLEWKGIPTTNVFYAEYQNRGNGANTSNRVKWARVLTDPREAAEFTVRNFIHGHVWIPKRIPCYYDLL